MNPTAQLKADIATTCEEKVAALQALEIALHDEVHGLELQHQARCAQLALRLSVEALDRQLDEQLDALALIPRQQEAT